MKKINDITLGVIGLGYVGLPLAVSFGKKIKTIGFDINKKRVEELKNKNDITEESSKKDLMESKYLDFTSNVHDLSCCDVFIIAVPTGIDKNHNPDFTPLIKASETVGSIMKEGSIVIYESTVFPGCTEEECVPVLEKFSGKKFNENFYVGYSPERINPGDKEHTFEKIKKITSGSTEEIAKFVDEFYNLVLKNGTFLASSIKTAEAAKVIENTQRDINVAFVNELTNIFSRLGIDTKEVLEAAETKWSFLKFKPGLVGGHCLIKGTEILMSDGTNKKIEDVKVGDYVITGNGNKKKITNVFCHENNGDISVIKCKGVPYDLRTTCNHKLFASLWKVEGNVKKLFDTKMIHSESIIPYHKNLKRKGSHRLHQFSDVIGNINNSKFARLLGLYLSEGSVDGRVGKEPKRVNFAFHENEKCLHKEVIDLSKELFGVEGTLNKPHSGKCIVVRCSNKKMTSELLKYGGKLSYDKKLNNEVFMWDKESLQELWNGWIDGDGHLDDAGNITVVTVSKQLFYDMYKIGLMLGYSVTYSIQKKLNKRDVYYLRTNSHNYRYENHRTVNVVSNEKIEYCGLVYDLEVEDDHSYIANTFVVSNCIGIDPYWLMYKSLEKNYFPRLINDARTINEGISKDICVRIVQRMIEKDMKIKGSEVLILGFTFKENCHDIRNTKVYDIYKEFCDKYKCTVDIVDPMAYPDDVSKEYNGLKIKKELTNKKYDVIILAVSHDDFININLNEIKKENSVVFDVKCFLNKKDVDDRL